MLLEWRQFLGELVGEAMKILVMDPLLKWHFQNGHFHDVLKHEIVSTVPMDVFHLSVHIFFSGLHLSDCDMV